MTLRNRFSLKSKTVFVAGGCGLLGARICRMCAGAGARVIVLDTNAAKGRALAQAIKRSKGRAHFEEFDVSDLASVERRMQELAERYGLDAWINATYPRTKDWPRKLENMTIAYVRSNVDAHLNSCLWSGRKAALLMKKNKTAGSIIHFGSIYGVRANDLSIYEGTPMSGEMLYCAVKGGIINMTRYLAAYFGPAGIRANTICPGGIWDRQDPVFVKRYAARTALKRMGTPQDIASAVLFLAGDAASYVTGTALMVDGGWTAV